MWRNRIITAAVGLGLIGLGPVGLAASADAAEVGVAQRQAAQPSQGDKPSREVISKVVNKNGKLIFKGRVKPEYDNRAVFIQKKNCKAKRCDWYKYKKVRTNKKSRYSARIGAPKNGSWFWRAKVKASKKYKVSFSNVWRTYTI